MDVKAERRQARLASWHLWFAWRPVRFRQDAEGISHHVWLERIERKGVWFGNFGGWRWNYRLPGSTS